MASGRLVIPGFFPALDRNGDPVSGAKLYVYENETTTLVTVYSDPSLSVPLTNPVVANSAGSWPLIWAEGGEADDPTYYSVAIVGPTGKVFRSPNTFDFIQPSLAFFFGQPLTPELFGAKGDGVTDDTTAIALARSASNSTGIPLDFGPKTYVTSPFTEANSITLRGVPGETVLYIKRGAYPPGAVMFGYNGSGVVSGLTIDVNDASFSLTSAFASVQSSAAKFFNNAVQGIFYFGAIFDGCSRPDLDGFRVTATSNAALRHFQIAGSGAPVSTDGIFRNIETIGRSSSHCISCDDGDRILIDSPRVNGDNNGAFGCSFTYSSNCHLRDGNFLNTGYEAFQFTLSEDCTAIGNFAAWDDTHGNDFGASFDGAKRCSMIANVFRNPYKSAIAIAADAADSWGNRVLSNQAIDAAGRANAAGVPTISSTVWSSYTSAYNNFDNEWEGNRSYNQPSKPPLFWVGEFDEGGAGAPSANRFKDFFPTGATPTGGGTGYRFITGNGFRWWHPVPIAYTPTITAPTSGAAPTFTINEATFWPQGRNVFLDFDITVNSAGGSNAPPDLSLPTYLDGAAFSGELFGRESVATGMGLNGEINGTLCKVRGLTAAGQYQGNPVVATYRWPLKGYYRLAA